MHEPDGEGALAVEVQNMSKSYGGTSAVRGASLRLPRGVLCAIVGAPASGKSTFLRVLATLESQDAGVVRVAGMDARHDAPAIRGLVGYAPERFSAYEDLTVEEYLDFYGSMYALPADSRRQVISELLELVDLSDQRDTPVGHLAASRQQWLAIARCLIHDPEVLLLDEPGRNLDPDSCSELGAMLRELSELDKTVVITAGEEDSLLDLCTHVSRMQGGYLTGDEPAAWTAQIASHPEAIDGE